MRGRGYQGAGHEQLARGGCEHRGAVDGESAVWGHGGGGEGEREDFGANGVVSG